MESVDISQPPIETSMRIPVELVVLVAEFLLGDGGFGSAASLSVTCKVVREETRSALYETMEWNYAKFKQLVETWEHGLEGGVKKIAGWRHVKYLVINDVAVNGRHIQKHQYLPLFPLVRVIVFRRSLRDSGEMTIGPGRQVIQRRCSLYVLNPVRWSVVDTIMRSSPAISKADADVVDILLRQAFSDDTEPTPLPTAADNIWCIDITGNGQLIPDRRGPFDASKFSIVGCLEPSLLLVELDDAASTNLSVDTLTGLLRLSANDGGSDYALGLVAIRTDCDLIPRCFTALASLLDSAGLGLALRGSMSSQFLMDHLEEWLGAYAEERQRCYRYMDAQTRKRLLATRSTEANAWPRPASGGIIPAMLEIIANPGANSSSLTISTTETFPEDSAGGRLDLTIKFFNMPGAGGQVGAGPRTKVYSYRTHIA